MRSLKCGFTSYKKLWDGQQLWPRTYRLQASVSPGLPEGNLVPRPHPARVRDHLKEKRACKYLAKFIEIILCKLKIVKILNTYSEIQTAAVTIISYKPLSDLNLNFCKHMHRTGWQLLYPLPLRVYKPGYKAYSPDSWGFLWFVLIHYYKWGMNLPPTHALSS